MRSVYNWAKVPGTDKTPRRTENSGHPLTEQPQFQHSSTLALSHLMRWAGNGLGLFSPDGQQVKDPTSLLQEACDGQLELDHDLTISSEIAAHLGLGALWYRLRSHPGLPSQGDLLPPGELGHFLELLAPELEFAPLIICDPMGRMAAVNGAAQQLLGHLAKGPLLGRSLEELLEQPGLLHRDGPMLLEMELPIDRHEHRKVEVRVLPYHDAGGRASGWMARFHGKPFVAPTAVDWQSLVEHFPGVVLRLDREGRVIFANRRVGGFTAEQVLGRGIFELVREDSRVTAAHFRDLVVRGKSSLAGEMPVRDPRNGETIWYSFNAVPILRDTEVEVLIYATDISLRVQAEQDLRDAGQRIRSLSSQLDRAQEEERRRISRELHDELGGMLTALRLEVGALGKTEGLPQAATEKMEALEGMLALTLSTVRRLSTQLRPQILDDLGLPAALEALLREAGRRGGFECDLQVPRSLPGDADLHLHLYRVCQEALTNICRHARAGKVRLSVTRPFRGQLRLQIEDDGRGFAVDAVKEKGTMGLCGIQERVQMLAGEMELRSAPGQGCRLKIQIPLTLPPSLSDG